MKAEKDNAMDRCDLCEQVRKVLFSVEGQSCKDRRRFHINKETTRLTYKCARFRLNKNKNKNKLSQNQLFQEENFFCV